MKEIKFKYGISQKLRGKINNSLFEIVGTKIENNKGYYSIMDLKNKKIYQYDKNMVEHLQVEMI